MLNNDKKEVNATPKMAEEESTIGLVETIIPQRNNRRRRILGIAAVILLYLGFIPFMLYISPAISEVLIPNEEKKLFSAENNNTGQIASLKKEISNLEKKIGKLTPGNAYLVVNTTENRFSLYKNRKLVREGVCSTGSYVRLETEGDQKWVFKTPKGDFWVRTKITDPVWRKPDWAFVEEGLPIPPANSPLRYERGVLGDYALAIGDGYLIHGTLYQRFLGLPVTHGCIRLGDQDLKVVFETLPVGAKVYIY
jgi:lipoprotein-anchoring transpeptidase ErfK/SrfK